MRRRHRRRQTDLAEEKLLSALRCPTCEQTIASASGATTRIAACGHCYHKEACWREAVERANGGPQNCLACGKGLFS